MKPKKLVPVPQLTNTSVIDTDMDYFIHGDYGRRKNITATDLKVVGILHESGAWAGADGSCWYEYDTELGFSPMLKKFFWQEEHCICMSDNPPKDIRDNPCGNPRHNRRVVLA